MAEHGDFQVNCWGPCRTQVYSSDTPPPNGMQATLAAFADAQCPIGGTANGCPSTTAAQQNSDDERPARLRQLIQTIRDRAPRTTRLQLPALATGAPIEVPVTWPVEMPDASYSVTATLVLPAALLGVIRVGIKPGSLTTTGCVLLAGTTQVTTAGQAGVHVVATP